MVRDILHYGIMGNVYVEHRAVFIGGWGPSYNIIIKDEVLVGK